MVEKDTKPSFQAAHRHEQGEQTDTPVTVIRPTHGWAPLQLGVLWEYRELLYFLVWRDIKVRYKQTALGAAWAVIQPFMTMVVFSIFFGRLAGISSGNVPYPIFAYSALVPWMYFANAVGQASNSLIAHENMLKKVYFPRLLMPLAAVLAGFVDFLIAFVVLLAMMAYYQIMPGAALAFVPILMLLATATALGVGLWFAALNVYYRDVRYVVPFLVQFWLFATPIAYPTAIVPEQWRTLYSLNPMVGVVEGFRWALLGAPRPPALMLVVSGIAVALLVVGGLFYFRRMEQTFADEA